MLLNRSIRPLSTSINRLISRQNVAQTKFKETQQSKVLTLPNVLTLSRIATTPAIGYFIWNGMHVQALTCFAFAAATDFLDGFIARKFKQNSDLGAILDPIADKLLLTTCFIAMLNTDLMPVWLVKGLVMRDLFILGGGAAIRYYGFPQPITFKRYFDFKNYPTLGFEPTLLSKCNTALQCSLVVVHLSTHSMVGIPIYDSLILSLQLTTAFTTAGSLAQYITRILADAMDIRIRPSSKLLWNLNSSGRIRRVKYNF